MIMAPDAMGLHMSSPNGGWDGNPTINDDEWLGISAINGGFSIAMLDYRR